VNRKRNLHVQRVEDFYEKFLLQDFRFLILAICTVGFSSTTVPAFAHDPSNGYRAGYERGYHQGYQHGYYDAVSGLGYENVAESYGPYGEGMHEGEHAGYDAGYRAGSGHHHQHHHQGFFPSIFGDDGGER
jgi:hypothetical protein